MQAWADVALLTKTKTQIGGFVVRCTTGLSFFLEEGMELRFVPPRIDCPRSARIISIEGIHDMSASVTFDSFTTMQQMINMVGSHCLIDTDELSSDALESAGLLLLGFTIVDDGFGELGSVTDVVSNPAQDLLVIDCPAMGKSDVLIPYVDEFVTGIDEDAHIVYTAIPKGLLEL
ncbi:MAG: 16S rRNA processing protein RimM [Eggerthellaceae bacterium]|nr:16S rRNA processing protein RimM [Eggerthellaceae bacterium]